MDLFLPSEIARLVYGYLLSEGCEQAADLFINTSSDLKECLQRKMIIGSFNTKINGCTLQDIFDDYVLLANAYNKERSEFIEHNLNLRVSRSQTILLTGEIDACVPSNKVSPQTENKCIKDETMKYNNPLAADRLQRTYSLSSINHSNHEIKTNRSCNVFVDKEYNSVNGRRCSSNISINDVNDVKSLTDKNPSNNQLTSKPSFDHTFNLTVSDDIVTFRRMNGHSLDQDDLSLSGGKLLVPSLTLGNVKMQRSEINPANDVNDHDYFERTLSRDRDSKRESHYRSEKRDHSNDNGKRKHFDDSSKRKNKHYSNYSPSRSKSRSRPY